MAQHLMRGFSRWSKALALLAVLFAGIAILARAQGVPCVPPSPDLVAWWPFDEGAGATSLADLVGGHLGTPVPGPVGSGGPGAAAAVVGGGLHFPTAATYVQVPHSPALNFGTGDFTIEGWVKPVEAAPGSIQPIVDKTEPVQGGSGFKGYRLYFQLGRLYFLLSDGTTLTGVFGVPVFGGPYGKWLLVVAFRQGSMVGIHVFEAGVGYTTNWIGVPAPLVDVDNSADLLLGGIRGFGWGAGAAVGEITLDELEISNVALAGSGPSAYIYDLFQAGSAGKCRPAPKPTADLGDAPDSTNHLGQAMLAYPAVPARFPTVFDPATGAPPGPKHLAPKKLAWLGADVSLEGEADGLPDADGLANLDPASNAANRDGHDDGVTLPIAIPLCGQAQFKYTVTSTVATTLYVNVWIDFNRDGDWDDPLQKCPWGPATTGSFTEWAVQNAPISVVPGGNTFTTPPFGAANPTRGAEMWMRITLTDAPIAPAQGADGSGPATGYPHGETEDYLLRLAYTEICGTKFHDLNANGVQDAGEPGLSGWVIEGKDPQGNFVGYAVTDDQGRYCLLVPTPGTYTVSEQAQSGWLPTTPAALTVTVPPAGQVNFGNRREPARAELCVFKFEDLDGDGTHDPNEPFLAGWSFAVSPAPLAPATSPVTTGPQGGVCFAVGAPGTYTITEQVQPGWTPTTPTSQTVAVQPGQLANVFFGNRRAEPVGACDLLVRKVPSSPTVASGQQVTYTVTVTNVGQAPCPGPTTLTEAVPAGLSLVSASGSGWLCLGNVCTYLLPIPAGGSVSVTYTFAVTAPAGSTVENCVTLVNASDPNPANNRACAAIQVTGRPVGPALPVGQVDLALTKLLEGQLRTNQEAIYILRVTNVGTATASGPIQVVDTLPPSLSFVAAAGAGWTCSVLGQTVTCTHPGPLPPGGTLALTLRVKVLASPGTGVTNCATVAAAGDANPANNRDCRSGVVQR